MYQRITVLHFNDSLEVILAARFIWRWHSNNTTTLRFQWKTCDLFFVQITWFCTPLWFRYEVWICRMIYFCIIKRQSRTVLSSVLLFFVWPVTWSVACDLWPVTWPVACNLTCDLTCGLWPVTCDLTCDLHFSSADFFNLLNSYPVTRFLVTPLLVTALLCLVTPPKVSKTGSIIGHSKWGRGTKMLATHAQQNLTQVLPLSFGTAAFTKPHFNPQTNYIFTFL